MPEPAAPAAPFPLTALVGQSSLREALLLVAVDPSIGGVLVSGPRGTAKSTAARSLAGLLPDCPFVTLPLGASEERLIGALDIDEALRGGGVKFSPGLLARAHRGVLYVDEVNLLADSLVDVVLDVAASGINVVERDGVSHRHAARFMLVGTMNPEEGELRPQLLDRFGLMVALENCFDPQVRQQIVRTRMAFDLDPVAFHERYAQAQAQQRQRILDARAALSTVEIDDDVHDAVSALCIDAQVDGMRADLIMLRAARALAALEASPSLPSSPKLSVARRHVERVADLVLRHRRRAPATVSSATLPPDTDSPAPHAREPDSRPSGSAAPPCGDDACDWGYLPPEATGTTRVKGVVALTSKKR
ncbi:magnesium chelatase [Pandoraea faecigallinarum]|uniref:Magnesium chelatase n=1 Tax=Pandoraea faecigallinarum TaxID=656179 RepID=A0A0H3WY47_9BURK|nr:ATP-binding protein [Pandoraea faecigallinarum]AKM32560.1 magnesium chelatase [Pandoraea faecigallinarum]